ncbi:hypothetical protein [Pseudomonas zeae]|uniref:hypothetical protein n=1 Tax=Pseudomonas zeae TaxID=2745510 RepID=UPI0039E08993
MKMTLGAATFIFPHMAPSASFSPTELQQNPQQFWDAAIGAAIDRYDGFSLYSQGFKISFSGSDDSAFNLLYVDGTAAPLIKS